ncbi:MFS transporter [Microvirgula curvata]|uniref:Multidrug transporter MdfA n=1 Tax=Microvirgula aerodenitrificans TaxID=57480 RepID=A0A2S0PC21_9NEIS|nr:MFS transporter [Microvirgula aerodenitrificans]AVY94934.1 multidrug transporter MdfA [Microvirgula aerodenitrificans]
MQKKITTLTLSVLCFPLALVLFEFAVYIANDMIQPGMLHVVAEFGVDISWVATSMTAFLLGGITVPWLLGPLSDRIGRRPVMLAGVALFVLSCLAMLWVGGIESFIAMRVLQGVGLCFIAAVGYAAVQEAFDENTAIKVTALMANVALIAPLLGPVAGAVLIEIWPWRSIFVLIAAIAALGWLGLWYFMPETVQPGSGPLPLSQIGRDYRAVLTDRGFIAASLCMPFMALPLLGWIALSPVFLIEDGGMSTLEYGLWQIPVFGALIAGNLILVRVSDRWQLGRSVVVGRLPQMLGATLMLAGCLLTSVPWFWIIAGISLTSLGEGLCFAVLYRFALTASPIAKGTVAASVGMLSMVVYVFGIEGLKFAYLQWGEVGYAALSACSTALYLWLSRGVLQRAMAARARESGEPALASQS